MPRVFAYGRHSTGHQSITEDVQRQKVEGYIKTNLADCEYDRWRYDPAVSGSTPLFEREEGRDLWYLSQKGDHIVWAKLDRAFRSVADGAQTLAMLAQKGVYVHSLDLGLDTSTAIGRCVATVMMAFAELEREYASERTSDALQAKMAKGQPYGCGVPYGWKKIGSGGNGRFEPDMQERSQIEELYVQHEDGLSFERLERAWRKVPRPNGRKWNHNTIRKALIARAAGFPKRQIAGELLTRFAS